MKYGRPYPYMIHQMMERLDIENVKNVATKNTKAVLMVHTYGLTADADEIEIFCKESNWLQGPFSSKNFFILGIA